MKLLDLLFEVELGRATVEMLYKKHVDPNARGLRPNEKKLSEEVFNEARQIAEKYTKSRAYFPWLLKVLSNESLLEEDLYKFGAENGYFDLFERLQHKFPKKNIQAYATAHEFIDACDKIYNTLGGSLGSSEDDDVSSGHVSPSDIIKLKNIGVNLLGVVDGYQVFEVPSNPNISEEDWKVYKNILGCINTKARESGKVNMICTIGSRRHFIDYTSQGDMYVFFNTNDPFSPYQFNFGANEFKDNQNKDIFTTPERSKSINEMKKSELKARLREQIRTIINERPQPQPSRPDTDTPVRTPSRPTTPRPRPQTPFSPGKVPNPNRRPRPQAKNEQEEIIQKLGQKYLDLKRRR